jgi:sugar transferase (PEP-CTERM/EpsH1 system associated)
MHADHRPLVLHLVYRFDTGGLENGVVNLINHMPASAYRHAVVALTEVAPGFAQRVRRSDVVFESLHKTPGHGVKLYPRLHALFRALAPAVVHTRNLAALECQVPAWTAGVPLRMHGEHGRDISDVDGTRRRYQWLRRAYAPFVHHWVALSSDLADYLAHKVGIAPPQLSRICNGVDAQRFSPPANGHAAVAGHPFTDPGLFVLGTVGRMQTVKAQPDLATAFVQLLQQQPALRTRLRLVMVGDGPLRAQVQAILAQAGLADLAWLPGERTDVPELMRSFDAFVLPSIAEGISNTILEAMACGLPVLATAVGGNAELVQPGRTGLLVPAADPEAMAQGLAAMAADPAAAQALGRAGRARIDAEFSLQAMVAAYQGTYDRLLARRSAPRRRA